MAQNRPETLRIGRPVSELTGEHLVAHTPSQSRPELWHSLGDHLRAVGDMAAEFAAPFDGADVARLMGYLHDAGKATAEVQEAFQQRHLDKGPRLGVPHKDDGAAILLSRTKTAATLASAMAIMGHHGGLPNLTDTQDLLWETKAHPNATDDLLDKIAQEVGVDLSALLERLDLPARRSKDRDPNADPYEIDLFIRMCFSALVDADFLDTAAHFAPTVSTSTGPHLGLTELLRRFRAGHSEMVSTRPVGPTSALRNALFSAAVEAARVGPANGIYRMPAPTGSGKTASAGAFALEHAVRHNKSRVIMAVPFTSITTQNAQVYRDLLQDNEARIVLEHHSAIEDADIDQDELRRLSAQNWDSEFIVTTTVQLFESLFSRKPSAMRKLHRISNSVIVLDEVQALPLHWVPSILRILRQLTENYGVTVLLASATQPAFWDLEVWSDLACLDISPEHAQLPQRVSFEVRPSEATWEEVADEIADLEQCLTIVNTTADAQRLHRLVSQRFDEPSRVLHLSTRMCGAHRAAVLAEVTRRLAQHAPIHLVSTQVVEAGVDFDFPTVFRAIAPAESVKQAAGRCNREGLLAEPGRVVVFEVGDAGLPQGLYAHATTLTRGRARESASPFDDSFMETYFRDLFSDHLSRGASRSKALDEARAKLSFKKVHDAFSMIDSTSMPVLVDAWSEQEPDEALRLSAILHRLERDPNAPLGRDDLRTISRCTVQVPLSWRSTADVVEHCGIPRWVGLYDDKLGVIPSSITESSVIW